MKSSGKQIVQTSNKILKRKDTSYSQIVQTPNETLRAQAKKKRKVKGEKTPEERVSARTFQVSISMDRNGNRRIRHVVFGGRPPTNYKSKISKQKLTGQGPHIVAYSLLEAAIRGQVVGASLIPQLEGPEKSKKDAIQGLRKILGFNGKQFAVRQINKKEDFKITESTIITDFEKLEETRDKMVDAFRRDVDDDVDGDVERYFDRQAVRKKMATLRQDFNFVTEDIMRLWNKRIFTVYDGGKDLDDPLTENEVYGSGINNRENSAITTIEKNVDELSELIDLASFDVKDSVEDDAVKVLDEAERGGGAAKADTICQEIGKLIDIKSPAEFFSSKALLFQFPNEGQNYAIDAVRYNLILEAALEEATRLGQLAYPGKEKLIDSKAIRKNLIEGTKDILKKRIGKIGSKTVDQKKIIARQKLQERLDILKKLKTK